MKVLPKAPFVSVDAVLAATRGAVGLETSKKGFAWEAQDDALFALGWPHLRILDPDKRGKSAAAAATRNASKAIGKSIEGHYLALREIVWVEGHRLTPAG